MENEQFTLLELYENGGNEIDSSKIGFSSPKNVNWKCSQCGMEWKQTLNKATFKTKSNKKECPYCMHTRPSKFYNLITKYPILEKEWNYEKNLKLPTEYLPNSHKKVWWICEYNSNHSWMDRIANRTILNRKCPICSKEFTVSFPARVLYYYLKPYFEDCEIEYRFLGKYTLDIYLPYYKIVIEYDGWYYHSNKESEKRENKKDKLLLDNNINIIRIKEKKEEMSDIIYENNIISYHLNEGYTNLDKLVEKVLSIIEEETNIKMKKNVNVKRDYQKIEDLYYHVRKSNSLAVENPCLAKEWSENNRILPDTINTSCGHKVMWLCPKCNREYEATVYNRVKHKSACTYCRKRK